MKITREWAMPSGDTFSIKPIKNLIERYIVWGMKIVDPFARNSKIWNITNDIDEETEAMYHLDAMEINKIYNEDCIEGMKKIPSASIDMVLTDPPYTSPTVHAFGRQKVNRLSDLAIQEFYFAEIKKEWERILKPNAPVLIFCDDIYSAVLMGLFYEWQQKNLVIWDKGKIGMGNPFRKQHELVFYANRGSIELNKTNLTHIPTVIKETLTKEHHGAEKPVKLLMKLIDGLTKENATVLDCFMGSGSTAVACIETKRNYIGFELDKSYYETSQNRISSLCGGLFSNSFQTELSSEVGT